MAAQIESERGLSLAKAKDWMTLAAAVVVVAGGLTAAVQWTVSASIAPLRADVRAVHERLDVLDARMDRMEKRLDVLPEIRERLTRVETLLLERRQPE